MKKILSIGALLLLAFYLVGCATEVGQYTWLGKPYPPKPANFAVEAFTNGVPARPFERAAILDAHCESQGWLNPNLEQDALPELKRQARAAGCDAIIEIEVRKPSNWTFETRTIHVTATGIVYK
jgi:hypothetical protein